MARVHPAVSHGATGLGALAAGLGLATQLMPAYEGEVRHAYPDTGGVWTACDGQTAGVHPGDVFTHAQCQALLGDDLKVRIRRMNACLTPGTPLLEAHVAWSFIDYDYNTGRFCSRVAPFWNAGRYAVACKRMDWPTKDHAGHLLKGLVRRRADEQAACLKGINS